MRPAQSSQILPTRQLVGKPGPKLLIRPRIVTPTDRTPTVSHDHTLLHSSRYAGHPFNIRLKADIDPTLQRAAINRQHPHQYGQHCRDRLLANASVNALTQQVGVTVVTGVLLDHVDQQLA